MVTSNRTETLIDYYHGAYGWTIRIDVQKKEWLEYLKDSIIKLMEGNVEKIDLHCLDNVFIEDIKSFTLIKKHEKYTPIKKLNDNGNCFVWAQDDELFHLTELIDGLLINDDPGHQYLTSEGEAILVVLAYKE